jgi:MFS transporter, DHA1 family, 2-module integral membrane pump EmrD
MAQREVNSRWPPKGELCNSPLGNPQLLGSDEFAKSRKFIWNGYIVTWYGKTNYFSNRFAKKQMSSTTFSSKTQFTIVSIVMFMVFLNVAILEMYVPSLPAITSSLKTTSDYTQLTVSLHLLGLAGSHLIYGPLSDYYGRRPVLLWGISLTLLGTFICIAAQHVSILILGRLIQGLGYGAAALLTRAILRDAFEGERLAQVGSYLGIVCSVTIGLAPALGGFIQQWTAWRFNFICLFLFISLLLFIVWKYLPETHIKPNKKALKIEYLLKNYLTPLKYPFFWGYILSASFAFSGMITYAAMAPFLLQIELGLSPAQFGSLSILIAIAQIISFSLNAKFIKKLGIKKAMMIGATLMLAGGFFLLSFSMMNIMTIWTIVTTMVIYIIGTGFIYANSYAGAFTPFPNIIGFVAAIYGIIQMGWAFIVSLVVVIIPDKTSLGMALIFTTLALLVFSMLFFLIKKESIEVLKTQ